MFWSFMKTLVLSRNYGRFTGNTRSVPRPLSRLRERAGVREPASNRGARLQRALDAALAVDQRALGHFRHAKMVARVAAVAQRRDGIHLLAPFDGLAHAGVGHVADVVFVACIVVAVEIVAAGGNQDVG